MLTAALRVYRWDRPTSSICSDRLDDESLPSLERALGVYRSSLGRARGDVRNSARAALEGLRPDRIEPVVKVLEDAATYEWPRTARCAERRLAVFESAAQRYPILDAETGREVLSAVLETPPQSMEARVATLYADYPAFHRLVDFPAAYTADELRADYDLAQAQALLYSATRVTVEARGEFKHILRYARLARLLYRLEPMPAEPRSRARRGAGIAEDSTDAAGYRFVLDGPNSVLRKTRAYGVDFAKFLAALVRLRGWRLTAEIELRRGWRPLAFVLSDADGLGAYRAAPPAFDSALEAAIAAKFGAARDGWRLFREGTVIAAGDSLLVPDFVFRHDDGTEVVLEIAGYWTPEYIDDKLRKLGRVRGQNLIVAVPKALAVRAGALPASVLPFRRRLLLRDLLPRLESFRVSASSVRRPD
jgi:uncharacterized protein